MPRPGARWASSTPAWDGKTRRCEKAVARLSFFRRKKKSDRSASPVARYLAVIAAWVGEKDLACEQLASRRAGQPSAVSYGELKLMPWWDLLRGEPCFEKIVASLAPKEN